MITPEQLAEWRRICGEAKRGPWIKGEFGIESKSREFGEFDPERWVLTGNHDGAARGDASDEEFVCASRTAMPALIAEVERLTLQKDGAYSERDKLIAFISKLFTASLERHQPEDDPDWDEDWKWIVIVDLPAGQTSWHINDSELPTFDHLQRRAGRVWDGHSTEEKYDRIAAMKTKEESK